MLLLILILSDLFVLSVRFELAILSPPGLKIVPNHENRAVIPTIKVRPEIYNNINKCKKKMQENKTPSLSKGIFGQKTISPI